MRGLSLEETQLKATGYNKALFDNMSYFSDSVWEYNLIKNEVIVMQDKIIPELQGKTIGRNLLDDYLYRAVHRDDLTQLMEFMDIESLKKRMDTFTWENRALIDGTYHIINVVVTPFVEEDGAVRIVYFSFRDTGIIADDGPYQEELGRMEVRFEKQTSDTLGIAKIGMWKIELFEGEPVRFIVDRNTQRLTGIPSNLTPEEAFVFHNERIHEKYRKRMKKYLDNMINGIPDEVVYEYDHPEQGLVIARCGGNRDRRYRGNGILIRGYHQDISVQHMKEKSLTDELSRYLSAVPCGIIQYTKESKDVVFVNDVARDIFGYISDEEMKAVGFRGLADSIHGDDVGQVRNLLAQLTQENEVAECEYRIRRTDGQEAVCYGNIRILMGEEGEEPVVQVSLIDITETKRVGKKLDEVSESNEMLLNYQEALTKEVERQTKYLSRYAKKLKMVNAELIDLLGSVVESRSLESGEHINRVKGYTKILANELMKRYPEYCLTPGKNEIIASASALHDIGKIGIADSILLKPGRLTDEEYEAMKQHTLIGYDIVVKAKNIWDADYIKVCGEIAKYHHERYDGGGYPEHLIGEEIPISAQIVSLADVYDALVSERCYKNAYSTDEAYEMIINGECGQFSPNLIHCFTICRKKFEKLAEKAN